MNPGDEVLIHTMRQEQTAIVAVVLRTEWPDWLVVQHIASGNVRKYRQVAGSAYYDEYKHRSVVIEPV